MVAVANALLLYIVHRRSQANAALLAALREMLESHRKTLEANQKLSDFNQKLAEFIQEVLDLLHVAKPPAVIEVRVAKKKNPGAEAREESPVQ
jgi:hypothetical protein